MRIGTKSLLFGGHQFILHPIFVGLAWWKLYGFPWDPRLWFAFFVHDLGYFGKKDMDGPDGERHVILGAAIMHCIFDRPDEEGLRWFEFCLYHSRFYAKRDSKPFSKLCVADKYSFVLTPRWLYLLTAGCSGEIAEYMSHAKGKYVTMKIATHSLNAWHASVKDYFVKWVATHKNCEADSL